MPARTRGAGTARVVQASHSPARMTAAARAAPFGRASPASAAHVPAHTHRPSSSAHSPQAAQATSSDSLYGTESTTACGSSAQSSTSSVAVRWPRSRSTTAWMPQAASSAEPQETTSARTGTEKGTTRRSVRTSPG
ncbi:hypothetical protein GA0115246_108874 [Streptomyces sp. SolWspMP-sol7th]|uniref:hypothetical protein n=1 Tax=Streptomyces sp. SolWspMP-sol7th TaxID=1839776 RepID=UPI00081F1B48|nr:hypothetical protein [Streptomyces sp. SolWspMP-sol7th]SCD98404.1 hypothetical protein GA0115246_108874 [Streptomyces sp. SolWspMP-sol7th]